VLTTATDGQTANTRTLHCLKSCFKNNRFFLEYTTRRIYEGGNEKRNGKLEKYYFRQENLFLTVSVTANCLQHSLSIIHKTERFQIPFYETQTEADLK
jgi:hypothetical protein